MKLDLQKAYDSVDWKFLLQLLESYCFPDRFVSWLRECICGVHYSIVLNGERVGYIAGRKGLRQGDPLSPLLFVLVMDYLGRSLNYATLDPSFRFHPQCKKLKLCHLSFADDLLIFCKGNEASIRCLMRAFNEFSCSSGLVANAGKSKLYCGGVSPGLIQRLKALTGFEEGTFPMRYLGVPMSPKK